VQPQSFTPVTERHVLCRATVRRCRAFTFRHRNVRRPRNFKALSIPRTSIPTSLFNTAMPGLRERIAPHLCAAIILFNNISFYSQSAPWLRLVELSSCREYYAVHDPSTIGPGGYIEEELCKLDPIQKKMAWLFMLDQLLHFVCGGYILILAGGLRNRTLIYMNLV
jgi:hypothetical protein